ncbi:hypothetical protein MNBD_IGNAVI01-473 [hydrothermal vent metagenome]|uniref:Uncharacterized protein n=1 Tax=hydrothermal vent metagenome TaxID=652676 RepID=A0A3B1CQ77_9ZZZZ
MKILIIINYAPYRTENDYNALRFAMTLMQEHSEFDVSIFLMMNAVGCTLLGQNTLSGYTHYMVSFFK